MATASQMYPILKRKFGNYDLERFDQLTSPQLSVGGGKIGKVKVDCRFKFEKSQWGVLGDEKSPAGIIYLDLDFHQPPDCQLKFAVVTVTIGDTDDKSMDSSWRSRRISRDMPVHLKPWYGPQQLFGQSRDMSRTKKTSMTPYADAMGFGGIGGIGWESEGTFTQESRWSFSGHLLPGESSGFYKTVQWKLAENDLEPQPLHSNIIHTAFSFGHNSHPFYMRVEVNGRLKNVNDRARHRFQKFASSLTNNGTYATTLIDLGGRETFQKRLDELAPGLRFAMEKENFEEAPIIVPKPQHIEFSEDTRPREIRGSANRYDTNQEKDRRLLIDRQHQIGQLSDQSYPVLQAPPSTLSQVFGSETTDEASNDPRAPTPMNLTRAFVTLTSPKITPSLHSNSTSTTLVNSETGDMSRFPSATAVEKDIDMTRRDLAATEPSKEKILRAQNDPEAVMTLLQMSGLLSIMKIIAIFLESCGVNLSSGNGAMETKKGIEGGMKKPIDRNRREI